MEPVYLRVLGQGNGGIHDDAIFKGTDRQDHTISIFTSDNGSAGLRLVFIDLRYCLH